MKKIYLLLIAVVVTATAWSQITRQWEGTINNSWANEDNWQTVPGGSPGAPVAGDIVIFDGSNGTIIDVPTITLGGLKVENFATIVLSNTGSNNKVTIANGPNAIDFNVDATSVLDLDGSASPNGVDIILKQNEAVRGSIAGQFIINTGRAFEANLNGVSTDVTGTLINRALIVGNTTRLHFLPGSTYIHDLEEGDVPDASWDPTSTCKITGSVFNGPRFLNRAFGNFIWDCPGQKRVAKLAASGMSVKGTFSVINTGQSHVEMDQTTLNVANLSLSGGTLIMGTDFSLFGIPIGISRTMNVSGNVSITGGTLIMGQFAFLPGVGTINVAGNFSHTGGTIDESGFGEGRFNFTGTAVQSFSKTPAGIISNTIDFTVNNNAKVDFGTSVLNGSAGQFTLNSGGRIITAHANGLSNNGTIQISRSFNSGADYEFRGPTTGVFNNTSGTQVRDLIINNTTGEVVAARDFEVDRMLILTNGYLTTSATNTVTIDYAANATTANGAFVNGRLTKRITDQVLFTFPVGKVDGGLRRIGITPSNDNNNTFTAEFIRSAPPVAPLVGTLNKLSACEYWDLDRNSGGANARVTLSWESGSACSGGGYVTSIADLRVAHLVSGTWVNEGQFSNSGTPASGTIISNFVASNSFSPFALASASGANPLPVVFADVKAYEKNNGVQVEWSNLTEKDVAEYTIERSSNGRDFSAIGTQLPTSNQNDKASYSGFDATPSQGINYYRIKAAETTGKIVYSKILSVSIGQSGQGLRLYPNPVTDNHVTLSLTNIKKGKYNLRVVNALGQNVHQQTIVNQSNSFTQTLDLPAIQPGMYNLVVTGDDYRATKTFIVQ